MQTRARGVDIGHRASPFVCVLACLAKVPTRVHPVNDGSIWVMDEGDFLSTSLSVASTRGKVYRVESEAIGTVNLVQ